MTDVMDRPLNPVDIETTIRSVSDDIYRGVWEVTKAETAAREAERAYDRAFAHAYLDADGPAYAKKYVAELGTEPERDALDVAQLAFRHAERLSRALDAKLRAYQSIGASVRTMYGATS